MKHLLITLTIAGTLISFAACRSHNDNNSNNNSNKTNIDIPPVPEQPSGEPSLFEWLTSELGDWNTLEASGDIEIEGGSKSLSSSMQMRMVRGKCIFISARPILGIEVARIIVTSDSIFVIDKVHKRYVAEKASLLTNGIPVTVGDVQDIFLGRPFILGEGTMTKDMEKKVNITGTGTSFSIEPKKHYKGFSYQFVYNESNRMESLMVSDVDDPNATYRVNYGKHISSPAGPVARKVTIKTTIKGTKVAFDLDIDKITWEKEVNIDTSIPNKYKQMDAKGILSLGD